MEADCVSLPVFDLGIKLFHVSVFPVHEEGILLVVVVDEPDLGPEAIPMEPMAERSASMVLQMGHGVRCQITSDALLDADGPAILDTGGIAVSKMVGIYAIGEKDALGITVDWP